MTSYSISWHHTQYHDNAMTSYSISWHHTQCHDIILNAMTSYSISWHHTQCHDIILNIMTSYSMPWHHTQYHDIILNTMTSHDIIFNTIHNAIHNKLPMDNMLTYVAEVEPRVHGYILDSPQLTRSQRSKKWYIQQCYRCTNSIESLLSILMFIWLRLAPCILIPVNCKI